MTKTTRWWWIRHAPVINPSGHIYGQLDVEADISDGRPYAGLGPRLPRDAIWVTTPLQRTRRTAEALMRDGGHDEPPIVEPDLMEQNFGDWQNRPHAEIYQALGARHPFWLSPAETRPPNGESFVDLAERVAAVVERLSRDHAGRDIVAVTHGGTIRAALAQALALEPERALAFVIDHVSLTRLDLIGAEGDSPAWRVGGVNLPAHLVV